MGNRSDIRLIRRHVAGPPMRHSLRLSTRARRLGDRVQLAWQVSTRRACRAVPVDRSTYHYRSKRDDPTALKKRIREIVEMRVR